MATVLPASLRSEQEKRSKATFIIGEHSSESREGRAKVIAASDFLISWKCEEFCQRVMLRGRNYESTLFPVKEV